MLPKDMLHTAHQVSNDVNNCHASELRCGCQGLLTYHASEAMRAEEPSTATAAIEGSGRDVDSIFQVDLLIFAGTA